MLRILPWLYFVTLLALLPHAMADEKEAGRIAFEKRMMASVGKRISVTGVLKTGKLSEYILTKDGGYVYVTSIKGLPEDLLNNPKNTRITVTGKLQYRAEVLPPEPGISGIPAHFRIDDGDAIISRDLPAQSPR